MPPAPRVSHVGLLQTTDGRFLRRNFFSDRELVWFLNSPLNLVQLHLIDGDAGGGDDDEPGASAKSTPASARDEPADANDAEGARADKTAKNGQLFSIFGNRGRQSAARGGRAGRASVSRGARAAGRGGHSGALFPVLAGRGELLPAARGDAEAEDLAKSSDEDRGNYYWSFSLTHGGLPRRICPVCAPVVRRVRAG